MASGFAATACIHPSQVDVIREAYAPTAEELDAARAVLAAAEGERGVFQLSGRMVDEPVLRHARAVMAEHVLAESAAASRSKVFSIACAARSR